MIITSFCALKTALAVTVVNLGVGAVSRIPAENIPGIDSYTDAVLFKILVLGANTLVIGLLVGNIIVLIVIELKHSILNSPMSNREMPPPSEFYFVPLIVKGISSYFNRLHSNQF